MISNINSSSSSFHQAHPMGMLISTFAALSTFHPEANPSLQGPDMYSKSEAVTNKQIFRILGKVITTAACAYRVRLGRPFNLPEPADAATYTENFLSMMDRLSEPTYRSHPAFPVLLDRLFVALADDGMNSATGLLRHVASSKVDPYTAISAAFGAAYGARISGVGDAVLAMLVEIRTSSAVPTFVAAAKITHRRLQGFGHLNYRAYDPRCRVVRQVALEVAELVGPDPLLDVAMALEEHVLADEYYVKRCVFPNVDLYLSLVFRMMGFPPDYFCVLVCIPRTAGFLAHWREGLTEKSARIARPRQIYTGPSKRSYVNIEDRRLRTDVPHPKLDIPSSSSNIRRSVSCGLSRKARRPGEG
jgi:citrate synthase